MTIPKIIGEAKVIFYLQLNDANIQTGNTKHYISGNEQNNFSNLAICQYTNDQGFYLFYCDENWNNITDTWHESIEDAIEQAEFEFSGTTHQWKKS